jgi:O-antigen/teichoic acid export membrane protein
MMETLDIHAPVGLLVTTRIANMVAGLLLIPVLIHYLGGEGFAAWAILLAASAVFFLFNMGMPLTLIKYMAVPLSEQDWSRVDHIFKHVILVMLISFGVFSPVVILLAEPAAHASPCANMTCYTYP